jgi:fucose permease
MTSLLIAVIYLAFVSLGLPDSLLGSAWPTMQNFFNVPSSYAGYISMAISCMTIISSLMAPRLIRKIHTKYIVIFSTLLTVIGLVGFSFSGYYLMLLLFAVPYGLGAGSIDAALNHYVANNYSSSVMNFLHCFYGLGAVISPNIMALALSRAHWNEGYRWTAYIQAGILFVMIISLPLWKKNKSEEENGHIEVAGIKETVKVPGVILTVIAFFTYSAGESVCSLWTSSYFAGTKQGMSADLIASFASFVFGGLMLGRLISGFVSGRLGDRKLIRIGIALEIFGIILVALPVQTYVPAAAGFLIIGTGMGPVYPAIQHMAPVNFGWKYSAAAIGLQMAVFSVGCTFMPLAFGKLQEMFGIWIMPLYLLIFALLNIILIETAYKKIRRNTAST